MIFSVYGGGLGQRFHDMFFSLPMPYSYVIHQVAREKIIKVTS